MSTTEAWAERALVITDTRCLQHRPPPGMPESPARLRSLLDGLGGRGVEIVDRADLDLSEDAAARLASTVHDEKYLQRLRRAVQRGDGLIDSADNPLSPGTWVATAAATAALLDAVDRGLDLAAADDGAGAAVFAAVRPPGHHALADTAMGFCYVAHVAVAAQRLLERDEIDRVAILDFDVHHGNGTQALFFDRADVVFASSHQWPFYPGTGAVGETGEGAGAGTTINRPLAAGAGDEEFLAAWDEILDQIDTVCGDTAPDCVLVSAGFDAWRDDPLGGLRVTEAGFRGVGERLAQAADRWCGGRLVSTLEGGYDVDALPSLVAAYLEGLAKGR
ncbi:MAG: histone deacetylase [Acidobacteriota bacterium]